MERAGDKLRGKVSSFIKLCPLLLFRRGLKEVKAKVKRLELLEALRKVQAACQKSKFGTEILHMVRIVAANGLLSLTGTDGSTNYITLTLKAHIKNTGAGCIPPDRVIGFLSVAATDTVSLENTGNKLLRIEAGHSSYLVDYQSAEGFCKARFADQLNRHKAKAVHVKGWYSALSTVAYAMAKEDTRPVLCGMLMKFCDGNVIELSAADGFRLARTTIKYKSEIHFKKKDVREFIIPREAVDLMCRLKEENYTFFIGSGIMMFVSGPIEIGVTLIQGTYPDIDKVIPDNKGRLKLDRDDVLAAIKQFSNKDFKGKALRIEPARGGVLVSMQADEGNKLSCKVQGKSGIKIAFNPAFLKDALTRLTDSSVVMLVSDGSSPAMFKDGNSKHVVMPMFQQW